MPRLKLALLAAVALVVLCSHDMFLKLDSYFLMPDTPATIRLFNGTFERSGNVIDRDRMLDASIVGGGTRTPVDTAAWTERDSATLLTFTTGAPGTYVAGVSTRARELAMAATDFNDYLEHEGGTDMLAAREREDLLGQDAVERYSKHVKTIFQVGETRTDDWQTELGYPIEFVPLSNPYELHPGDELELRLLRAGRPLADQVVIIGSAGERDHQHQHAEGTSHSHADGTAHGHGEEADAHTHGGGLQVRTDGAGLLRVPVTHDGVWHLRTIHLVTVGEPGPTHESNWATLTFEVSHDQVHAHGDAAHGHGHDDAHGHEAGLPSYAYWIGSLALIGGLFVYFSRRA